VGVVGFGHLGQFLVEKMLFEEAVRSRLEVVMVWNRSVARLHEAVAHVAVASLAVDGATWRVPEALVCSELTVAAVAAYRPDIIVGALLSLSLSLSLFLSLFLSLSLCVV